MPRLSSPLDVQPLAAQPFDQAASRSARTIYLELERPYIVFQRAPHDTPPIYDCGDQPDCTLTIIVSTLSNPAPRRPRFI